MSRSSKTAFLEEAIGLLVQHFGEDKVRAVLAKTSGVDEKPQKSGRRSVSRDRKPARPSVANALKLIQRSDPEKYCLLSEFHDHLKDRKILPESQDMRQFAHLVGLKDMTGKSRKDMIPALMHFLLELPSERLRSELGKADDISEQQRQQGFSVLTDKLVGDG